LVALGDAAFKKSFKVQKTAKTLANHLVESIVNELRSADLPHDKINSLKGEFSFIERDTTLTSNKDFFVSLIEQIDKNVNTFVRTHKYHDTLGQFYVQFLQYANRSLGTLLIPSLDDLPKWVSTANVDQFKGSDAPWMPGKVALTNFKSWKTYSLNSLFNIKKGKRLTKSTMTQGTTPHIGSIDSNNGVSGFIGQKPIHEGNTITVNYDGSVGEAFYQSAKFWATDAVNVLYPRFKLTPSIAMFLIAVIRLEKYRFNYGRKWNKGRMEESLIKLPAAADGQPDWQFMEDYIKGLPYSSVLQ
jgi:hypothetical protein